MEVFRRRFGMPSVCVYFDAGALRGEARRLAGLGSDVVSRVYVASPEDIDGIAEVLGERHDIRAVVPYIETALTPSVQLGRRLGVSWAENPALELFRDKHALKRHVASIPGGPRVNSVALVNGFDDVEVALASGGFDRFVLKPNDGFGNSNIGFFDSSSPVDEVAAHVRLIGGPILMEEFLAGPEYAVNGQVDGEGRATVLGVYLEVREPLNGRPNIQTGSRTVHRDDPAFQPLVDYVEGLVSLSGLTRSPFHAEVKFDDRGPCLVEVAARLAGAGGAQDMDINHGDKIDTFDLSAHYYLTEQSYGPIPVDWDYYDRHVVNTYRAVSTAAGRIYELSGIEQVERLPEFQTWVSEPTLGQRVRPTIDLESAPYIVRLITRTDEQMDAAVDYVRRTVQWNDRSQGVTRLVKRAWMATTLVANRITSKLAQRKLHVRRIPGA